MAALLGTVDLSNPTLPHDARLDVPVMCERAKTGAIESACQAALACAPEWFSLWDYPAAWSETHVKGGWRKKPYPCSTPWKRHVGD